MDDGVFTFLLRKLHALFVGTPNLESRVIQLRGHSPPCRLLRSPRTMPRERSQVSPRIGPGRRCDVLQYLEGLQYASACADVVATGSPLTKEKMLSILKAQAAGLTVKGAVREEYLSSMGLSRL